MTREASHLDLMQSALAESLECLGLRLNPQIYNDALVLFRLITEANFRNNTREIFPVDSSKIEDLYSGIEVVLRRQLRFYEWLMQKQVAITFQEFQKKELEAIECLRRGRNLRISYEDVEILTLTLLANTIPEI